MITETEPRVWTPIAEMSAGERQAELMEVRHALSTGVYTAEDLHRGLDLLRVQKEERKGKVPTTRAAKAAVTATPLSAF